MIKLTDDQKKEASADLLQALNQEGVVLQALHNLQGKISHLKQLLGLEQQRPGNQPVRITKKPVETAPPKPAIATQVVPEVKVEKIKKRIDIPPRKEGELIKPALPPEISERPSERTDTPENKEGE